MSTTTIYMNGDGSERTDLSGNKYSFILPSIDPEVNVETYFAIGAESEDPLADERFFLFKINDDEILVLEDINAVLKMTTKIDLDKIDSKITAKMKKDITTIKRMSFSTPAENEELFMLKESFEKIVKTVKSNNELISKKMKKIASLSLPDFIEEYAFKKHVLVAGEKGFSKSWSAFDYIAKNKLQNEVIIGHESIEAIDFIGHYIRTDDGSFAWKNGPLTSAFRKAAEGEKVVILVDELLRIPKREINILVGSLTPNSEEQYTLRTNRAINIKNGLAEEEVLIVPMENIFVIATTNIGSGYSSYDPDEALLDRFRIYHKDGSPKELVMILSKVCKEKGYSENIVKGMVQTFIDIQNGKKQSIINKSLNTRHFVEAIKTSRDEKDVYSKLSDIYLNVVEFDMNGLPNHDQTIFYNDTLKKNLEGIS